MKTICSILFTFALAAFVDATGYCEINTCPGHTMCFYPNDTPSSECGRVIARGLNDSEKDAVLTRHNYLRSQVAQGLETRGAPGPQPPASNLRSLDWDEELEILAQRWADQCKWHIDRCRDVERFRVGQMFSFCGNSTYDESYPVENTVNLWYENVRYFNSSLVPAVSFVQSRRIATYTQLVWAETRLVGCGKIVYEDMRGGTPTIRASLVCNYGPTGNWRGQPVYQIATPQE